MVLLRRSLQTVLLLVSALAGMYGFTHSDSTIPTQWDGLALRFGTGLALNGVNPYVREQVHAFNSNLPFAFEELFYPPSFIPLMAPFVAVSESAFTWMLVTTQILCFLFISGRTVTSSEPERAAILFAPLLMFSLYQTSRFGQISCFAVAALLAAWNRRRVGQTLWSEVVFLTLATVKPSVCLAPLIYLLVERRIALLALVGCAHLALTFVAAAFIGTDPFSLIRGWYATILHYRTLYWNTPASGGVYGFSTLLYQVLGFFWSCEFVAVAGVLWLWTQRRMFSDATTIALLLLVSFVVGTPHAYEFCLLLPALHALVGMKGDIVWYWVVTVMSMLPQRVLAQIGLGGCDSVFRSLAPLVLFVVVARTARSGSIVAR